MLHTKRRPVDTSSRDTLLCNTHVSTTDIRQWRAKGLSLALSRKIVQAHTNAFWNTWLSGLFLQLSIISADVISAKRVCKPTRYFVFLNFIIKPCFIRRDMCIVKTTVTIVRVKYYIGNFADRITELNFYSWWHIVRICNYGRFILISTVFYMNAANHIRGSPRKTIQGALPTYSATKRPFRITTRITTYPVEFALTLNTVSCGTRSTNRFYPFIHMCIYMRTALRCKQTVQSIAHKINRSRRNP